MLDAIPTFEACARWAVPNASFTYTSPKEAQYLASSGSFLDSFLPSTSSKRVFSNIKISPSFNPLTASSNSAPRVSATNFTSLPNNSDNLTATGAKLFEALSASSLTRPKCEKATTLAPWFKAYSIVGNAAVIRLSFVISPSFKGTLKSTRIKTVFPCKLPKSLIDFFMESSF